MKKTLTVYSMLFLFAFTFAFAFAMQAKAEAEPDVCCIVIPCPGYPGYADLWGHMTPLDGCQYTAQPPCDIVGYCPNIGP